MKNRTDRLEHRSPRAALRPAAQRLRAGPVLVEIDRVGPQAARVDRLRTVVRARREKIEAIDRTEVIVRRAHH